MLSIIEEIPRLQQAIEVITDRSSFYSVEITRIRRSSSLIKGKKLETNH
jgi:hypothetical protein